MPIVDVIVPVHRNLEATRRCIESVLRVRVPHAVRARRRQRRDAGTRARAVSARTARARPRDADRAAVAAGLRRRGQPGVRAASRPRRGRPAVRRGSRQRLARPARAPCGGARRRRHRHVHQQRGHRDLSACRAAPIRCRRARRSRRWTRCSRAPMPGRSAALPAVDGPVSVFPPRLPERGRRIRRRAAGQRLRRRDRFLPARRQRRLPPSPRRRRVRRPRRPRDVRRARGERDWPGARRLALAKLYPAYATRRTTRWCATRRGRSRGASTCCAWRKRRNDCSCSSRIHGAAASAAT